jgi:hypothetical protein
MCVCMCDLGRGEEVFRTPSTCNGLDGDALRAPPCVTTPFALCARTSTARWRRARLHVCHRQPQRHRGQVEPALAATRTQSATHAHAHCTHVHTHAHCTPLRTSLTDSPSAIATRLRPSALPPWSDHSPCSSALLMRLCVCAMCVCCVCTQCVSVCATNAVQCHQRPQQALTAQPCECVGLQPPTHTARTQHTPGRIAAAATAAAAAAPPARHHAPLLASPAAAAPPAAA